MLDTETKRSIDAARNILVGKVPDPKAQAEQITTALIYKFMDDMDKESQELGGKARFFAKGFEKYSWSKLLDRRLSGAGRLDLYRQAIANMSKNPHLPQLFRDIFKGAFLPYNDPETLSLFLKEINGFTYDHSENLGNAFEYLLSVLGSQGDAGQFRTPRHIIDFIVAVVDPAKHETVLDPACGTAGFLISAYKHILNNNTATPLTPAEKTKLMSNVVGYDISPDMVKLSLVNMYLHGFPGPQIHEYDTLTSEKRWGEQFDVIIANPPFMTPKGGIRPHKRFSVQASRSEVLFVDYILEHLSLNGRAGIIVPEGIIFQASNAYKQLRKMLVEDGLFAVVSLPPGVFNPYSGVKTSVLFFDNEFAKKRDEILFLKVENDGFDLGAQRREIEKNDLPEARKVIAAWKQGKKRAGDIALWIKKAKIADSGDYNLTGERYREVEVYKNQKWPLVELGDICEIKRGTTITKKQAVVGDIPVIAGGQQPAYYHNKANRKSPVITVSGSGAYAGFVNLFNQPIYASDCSTIEPKNNGEVVDVQFIYRILKSRQDEIYQFQQGGGQPHVYPKDIQKIRIPLPPLEVQKEIVEQIEIKQNAINHAKEIIKNLEREYFGQEIRKLENIEWVELGSILNYEQPTKYIVKSVDYSDEHKPPVLTAGQTFILGYTDEKVGIFPAEKLPVIIFDDFTTATKFVDFPFKVKSSAMKILSIKNKREFHIKFAFYAMQDIKFDASRHKRYWIAEYSKLKVPLPPIETQKQLVLEAEKEEEIITANRRLIELMEKKSVRFWRKYRRSTNHYRLLKESPIFQTPFSRNAGMVWRRAALVIAGGDSLFCLM